MSIKFFLNKELLKKGFPRAPLNCPLALLINEKLKDGYFVSIGKKELKFKQFPNMAITIYSIPTPIEAHEFICRFDSGKTKPEDVLPCEFEIDIPEEYLN